MDRKLYKIPFTLANFPDWQCPNCAKGLLRIKEGTFFSDELSDSKKAHGHEAWDPDWIVYTYSCLLVCTNDKCKEVVSNTGKGSVDWDVEYDHQGYPDQVYGDYYKPLFFYPHLKLISIPKETPNEVRDLLNKSFELFFCSPSAASNHIRAAIEALLTDQKVKRYETSNGKRRILSLHRRISLLPSKLDDLKDLFFAVKWLGNAGSHSGDELTSDDVMDAYEIMEHLLSEVYESKTTKVKVIAKKVNKAKGPKK
jgi:hypothetical protein